MHTKKKIMENLPLLIFIKTELIDSPGYCEEIKTLTYPTVKCVKVIRYSNPTTPVLLIRKPLNKLKMDI